MRRNSVCFVVLLFFVCLLCRDARAQSDEVIYSDSLGTGWADWSWCSRDFNSTDFARGGTRSVKVTYTAGWQGLYFRHTNFDSSAYTDLTFWINGGTSNNRNITVAAQINDATQAAVPLNNANWITITSNSSGIGNGAVNYTVAPNPGRSGRRGIITVAGQSFSVKQKGS